MTKSVEKKRGALPVYTQLASIIKEEIASGKLSPGIRIPSETKLAKQYDVSPMTVRQAISVLVDEDLVKRVHGSGTFVKRIEVGATTFNLEVLNRVLSDTDALTVHVLKSNISRVNGKEGNVLGLKPGDPVIQVERLIFHENQPFCFQSAYLPFDPRAPVVENMLDTTGLAGLFLSNSNSGYKKGELRLLPTLMNDREAELLQVPGEKGAFHLEYTYYDFKDRACAYGRFIIPHELMPMISQVGVWNE